MARLRGASLWGTDLRTVARYPKERRWRLPRADAARSEERFATASNIGSENHADRRNTLAHTPSMQLLDRNDEMRPRIDDPFLRLWFRVVAPHRTALAAAPREARLRYVDARAVMGVLK